MKTIRVLLADDHELVRFGVRHVLEDHGPAAGIAVIGDVASGEEAIEYVREHHPDVVLLDLNMPGIGGLAAMHRILKIAPQTRIIVLTALSEGPIPRAVLEGGASGYLTKGSKADEIIEAILATANNERHISREVAQQIALAFMDGRAESPIDTLSDRELHVMTLLAQGYRPGEIADLLVVSPKTISTYKARILDKLRVGSTADLVRIAMELGLVEAASGAE